MNASPGWYPQNDGTQRYWDGQAWTDHTAPGASPSVPPAVVAATPARNSTWLKTRTAVGLGAGLVGLIVGVSIGGSGDTTKPVNTDALKTKIATLKDANSSLKQDVDDAKASAVDPNDIDQQISSAVTDARVKAAFTQRKKDALALKKAVAKEKAKADARVRALLAKKSSSSSSSSSSTSSSGGSSSDGGLDPRFRTCGDANDAGYGPYRQGADPEYDWYIDRDGDGVDCEP